MVDPIRQRIQTGDYVIGKDARGVEWAGFFERLDPHHAQTAHAWVHIGKGVAQLRPLIAETLEERSFHAPPMWRARWERCANGVQLRTGPGEITGGIS